MKYILFFLMLSGLLVIPVGDSFACGSKKTIHKMEVASRKHHRDVQQRQCCERHAHNKTGRQNKTCKHHCGQSGCDCGHTFSAFAVKLNVCAIPQKSDFFVFQNTNWFFIERAPKAVYLSLLIPPNIYCLQS